MVAEQEEGRVEEVNHVSSPPQPVNLSGEMFVAIKSLTCASRDKMFTELESYFTIRDDHIFFFSNTLKKPSFSLIISLRFEKKNQNINKEKS